MKSDRLRQPSAPFFHCCRCPSRNSTASTACDSISHLRIGPCQPYAMAPGQSRALEVAVLPVAAELLSRHRDAQALLRGDHVVLVLGSLVDVDLDPAHFPGELAVPGAIVVANGRGAVGSHVTRLVAGEQHRHGSLDPSLSDLLPVDVEFHVAALAQTPAVVRELDPHLVLTGGQAFLAVDLELLQPEEVVTVRRPALVDVQ